MDAPKRGRGRPPTGKAMSGSERTRRWLERRYGTPQAPADQQQEIDRLKAEIAALRANGKPQETLQGIAAQVLSLPQQKRFAALATRLRQEMEARITAQAVQEAKREWVDGYLLPKWGKDIERLQAFERHLKAFTAKEYRLVQGALHPDRLNLPRADQEQLLNEAFQLVTERKFRLAEEPQKPRPDTGLPKTLAEMMARRNMKTR